MNYLQQHIFDVADHYSSYSSKPALGLKRVVEKWFTSKQGIKQAHYLTYIHKDLKVVLAYLNIGEPGEHGFEERWKYFVTDFNQTMKDHFDKRKHETINTDYNVCLYYDLAKYVKAHTLLTK